MLSMCCKGFVAGRLWLINLGRLDEIPEGRSSIWWPGMTGKLYIYRWTSSISLILINIYSYWEFDCRNKLGKGQQQTGKVLECSETPVYFQTQSCPPVGVRGKLFQVELGLSSPAAGRLPFLANGRFFSQRGTEVCRWARMQLEWHSQVGRWWKDQTPDGRLHPEIPHSQTAWWGQAGDNDDESDSSIRARGPTQRSSQCLE